MSLSKNFELMDQIQDNLSDKHLTKIAVIGDEKVGKSSIINLLTNQRFSSSYKKTVCFNVETKKVSFDKNDEKLVTFIDFSGQKNLLEVRKACYSGIEIVLAVCDVTRFDSLESLEEFWLPEFVIHNIHGNKKPVVQIIANKIDLVEDSTVFLAKLQEISNLLKLKYHNLLNFNKPITFSSFPVNNSGKNHLFKPKLLMLL